MKNQTMVLVMLMSLLSVPCMAQNINRSDEQWDDLNKLEDGKKITISAVVGDEFRGKFLRVEGDNLFIEHRKERIRLKRENIKWIMEDEKKNWGPPIVGAAIGFVAGALIGNYFVSAYSEGYDTAKDHVEATFIFGGMTAGCGYLTGSLFQSRTGTKPIYERD